ncbi:MAG: tRNA-specific adenosine deaminase [Neisseria sp.]|nr:tRNA-specific adenosine deaminase [Neisseria sp.]
MASTSIPLTTPPFAPKTVQALAELGIHTIADIRQTGAVKTFLLLKAAGHTVTRSVLWQLHAVAQGKTVGEVDEQEKAELNSALKQHPPVDIFPPQAEMEGFMAAALQQAEAAAALGEIPVGAVVVRNGEIIAAAHNACVSQHDISRHAEIAALAAAGQTLGNYRLNDCDVYITLEPCTMCASALLQARVRRVIFAAAEPKTGAAGSILNLFSDGRLNKHTAVLGGICARQAQAVLQRFFDERRKQQ